MLVIYRSTRFKRSFKRMPSHIREDFVQKIDIFRKNPFYSKLGTHKLGGRLRDYYVFCLRDGFRVLFDFLNDGSVLLINIGSHDDYKKW